MATPVFCGFVFATYCAFHHSHLFRTESLTYLTLLAYLAGDNIIDTNRSIQKVAGIKASITMILFDFIFMVIVEKLRVSMICSAFLKEFKKIKNKESNSLNEKNSTAQFRVYSHLHQKHKSGDIYDKNTSREVSEDSIKSRKELRTILKSLLLSKKNTRLTNIENSASLAVDMLLEYMQIMKDLKMSEMQYQSRILCVYKIILYLEFLKDYIFYFHNSEITSLNFYIRSGSFNYDSNRSKKESKELMRILELSEAQG